MSDSIRIAIIVNPALSLGFLANTIGAISIGLGAKKPLLAGTGLADKEGRTIDISSNRPVPILQANVETLQLLTLKAIQRDHDAAIVPFPAFARALHAFADYESTFSERDLSTELIDGLGLAGPEKWVKSLTGSLKLLR